MDHDSPQDPLKRLCTQFYFHIGKSDSNLLWRFCQDLATDVSHCEG